MFRYTKLDAKWVELVQLMQKFVPWSRIGIFRNERARSTPLNPKLMYWCVSWCLGAFWIVSLLHEARCKTRWTGAINANIRAMKSHRNFSQWTHPIHPLDHKQTFSCNSYYLGAFGTVWLPYETQCKTGRTSPKVRSTKSRLNFLRWMHPIHPIWH